MPDRMLAALEELPSRNEPLKTAQPFLMPRGGPNDTHITLPPEKENRKIRFQEDILVTEIENRFYLNDFPEDDDEGSYEIEIVEDDGDADFYLEIVDGEVFYVFETEDDISLESEDDDHPNNHHQQQHHHQEEQQQQHNDEQMPKDDDEITDQLNFSMYNINFEDMMLAPDLDGSDTDKEPSGPPMEISVEANSALMESLNQGSAFMELDNFMESSEEGEGEKKPLQETVTDTLDGFMEEEPETQPDRENARAVSEETLLLMEDEGEPANDELVKEEVKATVPNKAPELQSTPVKVSADSKTGQEAPNKPTWKKPTGYTAINTESTTARMVRERPESPSSPERPTAQTFTAGDSVASPSSPSKTKSILKSNPASPVKTPKKDRTKKKTEKTFSKTYVRADQLDGEHRVYNWAKPDWTTKNTQLRPTGRADLLREGRLEAPITFFPKKPVNEGLVETDPEMEKKIKEAMNAPKAVSIFGNKKNLKISVNGAKLREGQDIVKPITKATVRREDDIINRIANPGVLKPTPTGEEVRKGATLAAPVTFPNIKHDDTNKVANRNVLRNKGLAPAPKKQYEWSKPDWTKNAHLRNTPVGEAVKQGADLQGPITQAPHRRRKSFDSTDALSLSSAHSASEGAKSDEAIVAPRRGRRAPPRTRSADGSTGGLNGLSASQLSVDSGDTPEMDSYQREKLQKETERKERQDRLGRMARTWQKEEQSKDPSA